MPPSHRPSLPPRTFRTFVSTRARPPAARWPAYRCAGGLLVSDRPLAQAIPFEAGSVAPPPPRAASKRARTEVFSGAAQFGTRTRQVVCSGNPDGDYRVEIAGVGAFAVLDRGCRIECLQAEVASDSLDFAEALLGPALLLALAQQRVFCLHASAVELPGVGVCAFLAPTGRGKSTLARLLAATGDGVRRVADDVLAVGVRASGVPRALPHFPQLKLGKAESTAIAALPPRLKLGGLCCLTEAPPSAAPELHPVTGAQTIAELVRQTHGGVLFGDHLLDEQLSFARRVAGAVPVFTLAYPWRPDVGPPTRALLERALAGG